MAKVTNTKISKKSTVRDSKSIAAGFITFQQSAKVLASSRAKLGAKYADRWVAIYSGKVVGDDDSVEKLLKKTDDLGIDRAHLLIHYFENAGRKLIL